MQDFYEVLTSESKNIALPDEFNYFGKFYRQLGNRLY